MPLGGTTRSGSDALELLVHVVEAHASQYDEKQNGQSPASAHERLKLVHSPLQFLLFLCELRFTFAEEELVVLMHHESTTIDEQNYQHQGDCAPQDEQHDDWRQSRHIHLDRL